MIQSAVAGLVSGGAYAMLGVCLVLVYRMAGVLNFAQAAIGAFGAYATFVLTENGVAYAPALLAGAAVAAAIAALLGSAMATWFSEAGPEVRSAVTIAALIALFALAFRSFGDSPRFAPDPFSNETFEVAGVAIGVTGAVAIAAAGLVALGVGFGLRHTVTGVRLRALSERPTTAELIGIRARRLSIGVWAFAGAVSAPAVLVIAPSRTSDFLSLGMLIVPALAAALIGLLRSLELAFVGGLAIGLIEGLATNFPSISPYRQALPFLVIVAVLLWTERSEVWDAQR